MDLENTTIVEVQQIKTETVSLSDKDKQILLPLLPQFKALEVYEVSDIRSLIANIDVSNNPNLQLWVLEMQNVVRACNVEMYAEFLNKTEN